MRVSAREPRQDSEEQRMAWQIGVDVGGTFTDLLALDPERGIFSVAKVPSAPEDQSVGFIAMPTPTWCMSDAAAKLRGRCGPTGT
jgi:N-methylhydantoinase A